MDSKDFGRSHVMERSLALSGAGLPRVRRKRVVKNRFVAPLVRYVLKDGKMVRQGKWKCGHRNGK